VGETLAQKEESQGENILTEQLSLCLDNVERKKIIIAYEPVWAIGTGKNATVTDISKMNEIIRAHMNKLGYINEQFYILYGGSVNINNLLDIKDASFLNGFLIGGASLEPNDFWKIIKK
jgi:triosephosphate isomerase